MTDRFRTSLQSSVENAFEKSKTIQDGQVATYIPELSKANPDHFGVSVTFVNGETIHLGDSKTPFTLQSVSKPFVYGLALMDQGPEKVHERIGVEPTGEAFNSIIELEAKSHRPFNPMINSGAITAASLVKGKDPAERFQRILQMVESYTGEKTFIDMSVFLSEKNTGHRNRAIAHLLHHFNVIESDIESILDLYFQQCSILSNAQSLSMMAATLANGGTQPVSGQKILEPHLTQNILSLMFSCGMYDSAGKWAFEVGLPAKSGVSGAIIAVVPKVMGIAAYSPKLDPHGHSVRGMNFFKILSQDLQLSIFSANQYLYKEMNSNL